VRGADAARKAAQNITLAARTNVAVNWRDCGRSRWQLADRIQRLPAFTQGDVPRPVLRFQSLPLCLERRPRLPVFPLPLLERLGGYMKLSIGDCREAVWLRPSAAVVYLRSLTPRGHDHGPLHH
jgi:hypothetical protein